MADLKEIAEVAYRQIFQNATAATSIKKEDFLSIARHRYAYEMFLMSKDLERLDGVFEIPTALLRKADLTVINGQIDISQLKIFRSFQGDLWLGRVGTGECDCSYVKHSVNISNILCDTDYHGNSKPFVVIGDTIEFPQGTFAKTVPIIYASNGADVNGSIEVDDAVGDRVSEYLWKRYSNRLPEDRTNNANTNIP